MGEVICGEGGHESSALVEPRKGSRLRQREGGAERSRCWMFTTIASASDSEMRCRSFTTTCHVCARCRELGRTLVQHVLTPSWVRRVQKVMLSISLCNRPGCTRTESRPMKAEICLGTQRTFPIIRCAHSSALCCMIVTTSYRTNQTRRRAHRSHKERRRERIQRANRKLAWGGEEHNQGIKL